jgi:hypothetical protein
MVKKRRDRKSSKKGSKKRKDTEDSDVEEADNVTLFKVEKIIASKQTKNGTLYKVRWKGWGPADDTWEPIENVASTGHADRYVRDVRARGLSIKTPGVAMIEYDDGERQLVDLKAEKFRAVMDGNDSDRDDDTVDGDPDVNDFSLIVIGGVIELLWPYANIYFEAKIVKFCPILPEDFEYEEIVSDEEIVREPAKVNKGKERKKKGRTLDDSEDEYVPSKRRKKESRTGRKEADFEFDNDSDEEYMPSKRRKKESRTSKSKIPEDEESELDRKPGANRKEKTRPTLKGNDVDISYNDMGEEVLLDSESVKEKVTVSPKSERSEEEKTDVAQKQAAETSEIHVASNPKTTKSQQIKTTVETSNAIYSIPRKPKPPPPAAVKDAKSASTEPAVKKTGLSPTKPKPLPPHLPFDKPERRGKRDKRSKPSADNEDEVDENRKTKKNGKGKKTADDNATNCTNSTFARFAEKKYSYSVEDDEYLKSIQSTDEDNEPESNDEELLSDTPPERIGQGVPLFNEPEDEFSSDMSDYESDVSEEEIRQTAEAMDFERIWRMKLDERSSEILKQKGIIDHSIK